MVDVLGQQGSREWWLERSTPAFGQEPHVFMRRCPPGAESSDVGKNGFGLGPMYPVSTIVMQNVVKPQQLGTATGALNFFRTLGGAMVVAVFGAILLGGIGDHAGVMTLEKIAAGHGDLAPAFHWVFIAAAACLSVSFLCLLAMEERPLHGPMRVPERVTE